MALNPITALSEQLQKLINEHGSAAILRDHLALFKDKVVLLEKENVKLTTENAGLTTKIQVLQSEKKQLTKDNEELRSKIQEHENPITQPTHNNLLEPEKVKILVFLAKQDWINFENIPRSLNMNPQVAQFHLDELQERDMVSASYCIGEATEYSLAQEGRRYLIKNNLIT